MPTLFDQFIHLGRHSRAEPQPPFDGMQWYADYIARTAADGGEGWLVSLYDFSESWDSWEMHPRGAEVVACLGGCMVLTQEHADGRSEQVTLRRGDYAINPPGTWHTADVVEAPATGLFITAGEGTEHRPR